MQRILLRGSAAIIKIPKPTHDGVASGRSGLVGELDGQICFADGEGGGAGLSMEIALKAKNEKAKCRELVKSIHLFCKLKVGEIGLRTGFFR